MTKMSPITHNHTVLIISALHLLFVGGGIYYTIVDLIDEEEPVQIDEITYIISHVIFQIIIVVFLIVGTVKKKPILILPWLISIFILFVAISSLTLWYAFQEPVLIFLFNIGLVCVHWTIWTLVFLYYRKLTSTRGRVWFI